MNFELRYLGRSDVQSSGDSAQVRFAPNLARQKVFFDGALKQPLRFREAISALHDVVIGDHRFQRRDKTAYTEWKKDQLKQEAKLRASVLDSARAAELQKVAKEPIPRDLKDAFSRMHARYWKARRQWADELRKHDPALFRALVPCDPVVTVAPDSVFFECFAKDESSYGCLLVDRDAFTGENGAGLGTTNVDYSLSLYDHFQTLRTYRSTRLLVDPTGFEVNVQGQGGYREEKIDLPPSWLRGFGQLQAAMGLPTRRVSVGVEAVYSLLAHLKRHREKSGPRSIVFRLRPGQEPVMVVEPWGVEIPCRSGPYDGERAEDIKVWGRRRLMVLARVLPLTERVEVNLLGSGLPSIWTLRMGEMRFVLGLSGWTTNDWSSGAALELLSGAFKEDPVVTGRLAKHLEAVRMGSLSALTDQVHAPRDAVLGSLHALAKQGQVMFDFSAQLYRYRPVLPVPMSESVLGPEHPELVAGRQMHHHKQVKVVREELLPGGRRLLVGDAAGVQCEGILDSDGGFSKGKCGCSFFHKTRLRAGPCRHLLSLRLQAEGPPADGVKGPWVQ